MTGSLWYDRVKESCRFASRAAIAGALAMGLSLALFAPALAGLLAKAGQSEEMLRVGLGDARAPELSAAP